MKANYEQSSNIPLQSLIEFKEYELDRHENKKVRVDVSGVLHAIIAPNEKLSSDLIEVYYKGVSEEVYPVLSCNPFVRLVLTIGTDKIGSPIYRVIALNTYYMSVGLQDLEYEEQFTPQPELLNQILGFNSYSFGGKFK